MSGKKSARVVVRRPSQANERHLDAAYASKTAKDAELELISTQMLKQILSSSNDEDRNAIRDAADSAPEGVLARDTSTGIFEMVTEADLQTILKENDDLPKMSRPADVTANPLHDYADSESLSLVSAQALRNVFDDDEMVEEVGKDTVADMCDFNPYEVS
jgi:hypothetical protein